MGPVKEQHTPLIFLSKFDYIPCIILETWAQDTTLLYTNWTLCITLLANNHPPQFPHLETFNIILSSHFLFSFTHTHSLSHTSPITIYPIIAPLRITPLSPSFNIPHWESPYVSHLPNQWTILYPYLFAFTQPSSPALTLSLAKIVPSPLRPLPNPSLYAGIACT